MGVGPCRGRGEALGFTVSPGFRVQGGRTSFVLKDIAWRAHLVLRLLNGRCKLKVPS